MAFNAGPQPEMDLEAGEATHLLSPSVNDGGTTDEDYEKYSGKPTVKEIFVYGVSKMTLPDFSFHVFAFSSVSLRSNDFLLLVCND